MLRGRAFGPLWERRGANGEPTLPGFSPFLNFPPSGQGNPDLCVFLLKSGKNVIAQRDRAQSGPDILVKEAGETIWIEAVTPTPGEPPRPDRADGEVYPVPDDSLLLRFLQAMNDKRNRLQSYVDDSLIAPDDLRIIAINAGDQKGFGGSIRLHAVGQSRGAKQLLR